MSTKTTLKRIALVAVSALGFGLVSAIPSSAAVASFALRHSSVTVVDASGTGFATFVVQALDSDGVDAALSGTETIQVATTATPNQVDSSTAASALTFSLVTSDGSTAASDATLPMDSASVDETDNPYDDTSTTDGDGVYYVKVLIPADARDAGFYTIRFTLSDGTDVVQRTTATVKMVTSVADLTDATLSVSAKPTAIEAGAAFGQTASTVTNVTVTNGRSGVVVSSGLTTQAATVAFRLSGADCDVVDTNSDLGEATGSYDDQVKWDGVFSIAETAIDAGCVGTTTTLRAAFLGSGVSASDGVVVTAAASKYAVTSVTATGKAKQSSSDSAYVANYWLPLTTTSATVSVQALASNSLTGDAATGTPVYYTVAYSGCVTADMSPTANTLTKLTTDSTGVASVTITNANPIDECQATVTFSGISAVTTYGDLSRIVKWDAPRAVTVTSTPGGNYQALLASSNTVTFTVLDQYTKPVVGKTATLALSSDSANYSTAGLPSKVTDSTGSVAYTWTDAAAVSGDFDKIYVTAVGSDSFGSSTGGPRTITYKSALSAVASLYATYDSTTSMSSAIVVPSTNIGGTAGRAISDADQLDLTGVITGASANHFVALQFTAKSAADAAVTGVPTTVTIDNGYILGSTGLAVKTRTLYANEAFYVLGTKTGVATVTATNGSITSTAKINWINAAGDARVLSATESAGTITTKVTDFAGNTVSGVSIDVSVSAGKLGNGATFATFTTDANGVVSFDVIGAATATVKLTSAAKSANLVNAGNSTGTVSTPGSPAGVRSVAVTTSGKVDEAKAAAEAATDAAAEAIDAANAATDAANLAAEAADAATVAAEEARDAADAATAAVEELATQVATLMAALKAQITTLANTVAKIAKKVKA